jgi:tetratricopeptide (TPR) repeat protein
VAEPPEYQAQAKLYTLYDQGLNARLNGDSHTAVSRLAEAAAMIASCHLSPTMEAMIEYEFGRAAEGDQEPQVAIDAYRRCITINPRHLDAVIRLSSLLLRSGQPAQALVRVRDLVQRTPNDPRAHVALAFVLERNGFPDDARLERDRAKQLISGVGKVPEPTQPIQSSPSAQSIEPVEEEMNEMQAGAGQTGAPAPQAPLGDALAPAPVPGQTSEGSTGSGAPPPSSTPEVAPALPPKATP